MTVADSTVVRYRGFVFVVSERDVLILDRRGRTHLGRCRCMSSARRFVKGFERAEREEVSPVKRTATAAHLPRGAAVAEEVTV